MYHPRFVRSFAAAAAAILVLALLPGAVLAIGVTHFRIDGPTVVTAGHVHTYTVTALDASEQVDLDYVGSVGLASDVVGATLTSPVLAVAGVATFNDVALAEGPQTLTATEGTNTGSLSVNARASGLATHLVVTLPATGDTGVPVTMIVSARDDTNVTVDATYTGTVHFTSTDGSATVPGDHTFDGGDSGSHTFTNGVTFNATGTWTVTAADNAVAGINGTSAGTLVKHLQTITFGALADKRSDQMPITVSATATSSLGVTFSSSTTGVCTVTGGNQVNYVSAGTCTIAADQAGDATWDVAPTVSHSFQINVAVAQTITFAALTDKRSDQMPITVSASSTSGLGVTFSSETPGVCTVTAGTTVNYVSAGTCTIDADQAGNSTYDPALTVSRGFVINVAVGQTITFGALADKRSDQLPLTVAATSTSGLGVTFSSGTIGVCTVTGGDQVNYVSAGTCTIHADQAGNATYDPAPTVSQSFQINGAVSQTITFAALTDKRSDQMPITVSASSTSGLGVTFSTTTTTVCTVTAGTTVNYVSAGTCTIHADQAGDATYDPAVTVSRSFQINVAVAETITFNALTDKRSDQMPFTVSASSTSGLGVTFSSVTLSVCTVTAGTTVNYVSAGTCTIHADQAGDATYDPAVTVSRSFQINVAVAQTITFNALTDKRSDQMPITVAASSTSGLGVTFSSVTLSVCTVTGGDQVNYVSAGTCTIHADQAGDSTYDPASTVSRSFQANLATAQTITFNALADKRSDQMPITVSATASSSLGVTFSSVTLGVCTVTLGTQVNFVSVGTCTIHADQVGDATYDPAPTVSHSFQINTPVAQTITFNALSDQRSDQLPITVSASSTSGLGVTFSSVTLGVCTVTGGDQVNYVSAGTCTIHADQAGNATYDPAVTVSRSFQVNAAVAQTITFAALPDKRADQMPITVSATATSSLSVTFSTTTTTVCTVTAGTTVNYVGAGICTIDADQAGNTTYDPAVRVSRSFAIGNGISQTITFNALADKRSDQMPITVSASSTSGLSVTFSSVTLGVCTVTGGDQVNYVSAGTCTIHADQAGDATYNPAPTVSQSFQANLAVAQTITFNALTDKRSDQMPITVSATSTSGLGVTFSSVTLSVCTVTAGTTVNYVSAGTCTIHADQAGNATYDPAGTVSRSFQINVAVAQTITFNALADKRSDQMPITVSATSTSGLGVTFSSETTGVCTVTGGTTVNYVSAGTCTIDADQAGNATYDPASTVSRSFVITDAQTITFGALSARRLDQTGFTLVGTASSGLSVTFSSSTLSVCTVSGTTVTLLTHGTCTISADQGGNSQWAPAPTVTHGFTVNLGNQTVSFISSNPGTGSVGGTYSPTGSATSGLTPAISVDGSSTGCTIDGSSVVHFTAPGTCQVNLDQSGNADWNPAPQVFQSITVTAGMLTALLVTAPGSATAGTAFNLTVVAKDGSGNTVTSYTGSIHITSSDGAAVLPGDYTFVGGDSGSHTFTNLTTLKTVGSGTQTVTATDKAQGSVNGTSGPITMTAAATTKLAVVVSSNPVIPGATANVTVTAQDAFNNTTTGYTGTVHFTGTDASGAVPANYAFVSGDHGVKVFTNGLRLVTPGNESVTATDTVTGSITGSATVMCGYPASTYHAIQPARVLDTRPTAGVVVNMGLSGTFVHGVVRQFQVSNAPYVGGAPGAVAVPPNAVAVTGNLTATGQNVNGLIALGPTVTANGETTTINFTTIENRANNVTVGLAPNGSLQAVYRATSGASVNVIFDVTGYFTPDESGAKYHAVTPGRVLDTRPSSGPVVHMDQVGPAPFRHRVVRNVQVTGVTGIGWSSPQVPTGAWAITANVTVTNANTNGFVSFGPSMVDTPSTSTVNVNANLNTANGITVQLNGSGGLQAVWYGTYSQSTSSADVILDVTGYFTSVGSGQYFYAITPTRMVDSQTGRGGAKLFANEQPQTFQMGGVGQLPADAAGIAGNMTLWHPSTTGYGYIGPVGIARAGVSTLNSTYGQTCANGFDVKLSSATNGKVGVTWDGWASSSSNISLDITGYWK